MFYVTVSLLTAHFPLQIAMDVDYLLAGGMRLLVNYVITPLSLGYNNSSLLFAIDPFNTSVRLTLNGSVFALSELNIPWYSPLLSPVFTYVVFTALCIVSWSVK